MIIRRGKRREGGGQKVGWMGDSDDAGQRGGETVINGIAVDTPVLCCACATDRNGGTGTETRAWIRLPWTCKANLF
ncbi:hypothetical protein CEXT_620341 [Caerostris extrusa]|uniref:Uncharacterized protein n=1 Tax=Caerostris extrusa TaxID=172846 RepID=A0AAV4Y550_CAEEX|nr:hypothetical protein CEXT_620341 [Caerostris extrusa]